MALKDSGGGALGSSRGISAGRSAASVGGFNASGGGGNRNVGRTAAGGSGGAGGGGRIDVTKPNRWGTPGFIDGYQRSKAAGRSPDELRIIRNEERDKIMAAMRRFAESRK